jgi:FMN-dependent NADH-azoreductase
MTTLLQINASINDENGQSSQLANQFVAAFRARNPDARIVVRNVAAAEPVPHLNAERFGAFITQAQERSAA